MIQKSSASLQGSLFSELKELLSLIGDPKKAKEQLELISEDIASLKELYKKNQQESERLSKMLEDLEKNKSELQANQSLYKEEKEFFDKKKNAVNEKEAELSLLEKKVKQQKTDLETEFSSKINEVNALKMSFEKSKQEADEKSKQADSLIKEYEEKLSKLKAMVG